MVLYSVLAQALFSIGSKKSVTVTCLQYTVRSRTNGNSNKWEDLLKTPCNFFANKWEFEQVGIFGGQITSLLSKWEDLGENVVKRDSFGGHNAAIYSRKNMNSNR